MHITHIISGLDRTDGGPTTALLGLASALARLSVAVTVVATPRSAGHSSVVEELSGNGVRVRLNSHCNGHFSRSRKSQSLLMEEIAQADAVHIHALWEEVQYQAICISRLQRKPYIVRPCGLLDPWSMAQNRIKKRLYLELRLRRHLNAASALHFTTPLEEERARPLRLHAPTVIEPNGVDLKLFRNCLTPGSFRERLDIPNDAPLVLFLGRLHPKKGLDLLIPAFAKAAPANAVLAIAGEGDPSYEDSLRREVVSCGLKNRAKFVGFLDGHERIAAFFDATLFVLPSYSENFAIAVIESLAAGTPVIVSDQVNIHPDIEAAKVGGVTPAKLEDLSNEIHTWLNDTAKREQAIIRAHEFVASYDMSEIAARWLHHYRDLSQGADNAAA